MRSPTYAAVDVGAESGRVVAGRLRDGRMELEVTHRFANLPMRLVDGLHWNLPRLFGEALLGIAAAAERSELRGVAVDSWGVDYALLDGAGRMLGPPFHYRDKRTAGMVDRAHGRMPAAELYAATGIQTLPFNTAFQLLADERVGALAAAERIALVPDLLALCLSGELANERTAASTTGLLDACSGEWATAAIERLGLPSRLFGDLVDPGTPLGPLLPRHGLGPIPVIASAAHDTAAAFAAVPLADERAAILSSGTWSLLGVESPAPVLTDAAREANLTNERGIEGTTRLLHNVMGLWLVQECRRSWAAAGAERSYEDLMRLAAATALDHAPVFDPDDESLLAPGDMPARIEAACAAAGQRLAPDPGSVVCSILVSLACKYRYVLERIEEVAGRAVSRVHVVGGGARNTLLCQLTADLLLRPVTAGPVEATALGNLLVQAHAAGELGSLSELREVAAASAPLVTYQPDGAHSADRTYGRFLSMTGLPDGLPAVPCQKEPERA